MNKNENDSSEDGDTRYHVPALARGLEALRVLGDGKPRNLTALAAAIGVTRSSAFRICQTLVHSRFLVHDQSTKTYAIGPAVLQLSQAWLGARDLVQVAFPYLQQLRDVTGWSAHLAELQGREAVYLARVATRRAIASTIEVGTRLPAHATSMGRVLLSGLSEAAVAELYAGSRLERFSPSTPTTTPKLLAQLRADVANGFAVQDEGFEPGVASVAAPVRDASGRIVAAVNVSAVSMLIREGELHGTMRSETVKAAAALSRALGWSETDLWQSNSNGGNDDNA